MRADTNEHKVLIIDDDSMVCRSIDAAARKMGLVSTVASTIKEGYDALSSECYGVVFLDLRMPDGNGLDMLPKIRMHSAPPEVIVITGYADPESVEQALSLGAWDYIEKPFSRNDLIQLLKDVIVSRDNGSGEQSTINFEKEGLIGNSPAMRKSLDLIGKATATNTSVLITGETGTGKEACARIIHNHTPGTPGEFVIVDCAAIPPTLTESILFGHEKGSYTGADRSRKGLIAQAHQGTLFLDEVGELPLFMQKKLLRVLQEGKFRPVGRTSEAESDFRVISATNKDLDETVGKKRFREDLLFRLRSLTIDLPPLRERTEDIPALTESYLRKICGRNRLRKKRTSPSFLSILRQYSWPGNVRELIHALESSVAVAHDSPILVPKHLPYHIHVQVKRSQISRRAPEKLMNGTALPQLREVRDEAIGEIEQQYLHELMRQTKGNVRRACAISGLSRSRLYALLKQYDMTP